MKKLFPYIQTLSDLPPTGTREDQILDLKGGVERDPDFECGKDMSAFANASGGVLLIGAAEDSRRGQLAGWVRDKHTGLEAFSAEEANSIAQRYRNVAKDSCESVPLIAATPISLTSGRYLVAINVAPQVTGQAVGVRMSREQKPQVDVWAFFQRVGTDNLDVRPEQLPMLLDPKVRRSVIFLRSIPDPKRVVVVDANGNLHKGSITDISEGQNIFVVNGNPSRTFPIDAIKTAYATIDGAT